MDDFTIDCTGDVVVGDTIRFTERVFEGSHRAAKYVGTREITAEVLADSYGAARQQHTFTIKVIECSSDGEAPAIIGKTSRKGRNIYRHGCKRLRWADESRRAAAAAEKHARGDRARMARDARRAETPDGVARNPAGMRRTTA